jgi:peptide/nickel transport system ATP-binding protein
MTASAPLLEIDRLRIAFATRNQPLVAVDDISFQVAAGEVLGIVGESGAGKSITGMAIAGLIEPPGRIAGGAIRLDGQRIDDLPEAERRRIRGAKISMVFQDPQTSLDPLFTIGDQLVETMRTHLDMTRAEARGQAVALLDMVGIPDAPRRVDDYPHLLSGGMRQRVVIALALCARPRLIVADEPTTALDVSSQAQVIDVLKRLCAERGTAVILVTHDMGVIAETAHRVAVMYAGRIVEIGPVRHVVLQPSHPYTEGLMASIPSVERRTARLAQIDGYMPRLGALPPGCAFQARCPKVTARCRTERPELRPSRGVEVACWAVDAA